MLRALYILAALLGLALAADADAAEGRLTGRVAFRDTGAVPPDAIVQVVLAEVNRGGGGAARALGVATLDRLDGPPYGFDIRYDPAGIRPEGTYVLRAELSSGGQIVYRSRGLLPVLTGGAGTEATLWLARIDPVPAETPGLDLPASFTGTLPCKDCKDVQYTLNLWPDRVFYLRRTWEGKDMRRDAIGRWSVDPATDLLTLHGAENDLQFELLAPDRLRRVPGSAALPPGEHTLAATRTFEAFDPVLPLRGLVTWGDDRATIVECLTGRRYPVAEDGDYNALEHAYLAAGAEPGSPLMASFDGAILQGRRPERGRGEVVVERFVGVWPEETCDRARSPAPLRNTYWRLLRLGETEVAALPNRREPSLVLREGERRFSATVGCNPIAGRFTLDAASLHFGGIKGPRLDCPSPLDALEDRLVDGLQATATWRISGQSLELFDADGVQLALLQAVNLY